MFVTVHIVVDGDLITMEHLVHKAFVSSQSLLFTKNRPDQNNVVVLPGYAKMECSTGSDQLGRTPGDGY
jgi:hypothetical protein